VVDTNVGFANARYDSSTQSLAFTINGDPTLPPTVQISLTSGPVGITLGTTGDCSTVLNPTVATCQTANPLVERPFLRAVTNATGGATFTGSLPLVIPTNQPKTTMTFTVSLPADSGFWNTSDSTTTTFEYVPPVSADIDVSFTDLVPNPATTGADGRYELTGQLGVPDSATGTITFTLSGAATFVDTPPSGCALTADPFRKTITCTNATNGPVHFVLAADDNTGETPVTITASALSGYTDENTSNNHPGTILRAAPVAVPDANLSLTGLTPNPAQPAQERYSLTGTLGGDIPAEYTGPVRFTVSGGAKFVSSGPCTWNGTELACTGLKSGPVTFVLTADDPTRDTDVTITVEHLDGYTDNDTTHNTADATLTRGPTTNNLVLSGQLSGYDKKAKTADLSVTVAGAPSGILTFKLASTANVVLGAGSQCKIEEGVVCEFDGNGPFTTTLKLSALPPGLSEKLTLSVTANNNTDNGNQNIIKITPPSDDSTGLVSGVINSLTGLLGQ
jgi:hypothetical protein